MSATIATNDLKFVAFGAGHDYTRLDSGRGDVTFFSHPYVPLNSINYAGQYYMEVPDEDGNLLDAVKDDLAHCTFTPSLGSTFDTEGEIILKIKYRREYIHEESTVLVEKELTQPITVVNHGTVANTYSNLDVYSDGYGFIRPNNANVVEVKKYALSQNNMTKCSSIPWRATGLGRGIYGFISSPVLTDIEELGYADTSNCESFDSMFHCALLSDISPLEKWDTSSLKSIYLLFEWCDSITSIEALRGWDVSNVTFIRASFQHMRGLTSLDGLEEWDVSNVEDLSSAFSYSAITDISALENWDVSKVRTLAHTFHNCPITSLDGLENWDVSSLENLNETFKNCKITSLNSISNWDVSSVNDMRGTFVNNPITSVSSLSEWNPHLTQIRGCFESTLITNLNGLGNFDVSEVQDFYWTFGNCGKLLSADGIESWDVSNGTSFNGMFRGTPWLEDVSALATWDTSKVTSMGGMFDGTASILNVDDFANWDFSLANVTGMFNGFSKYYSSKINKDVWANAYYYFDYDGTQYTASQVDDESQPLQIYAKDADGSENWNVNGTNKQAFDNKWANRPSWN